MIKNKKKIIITSLVILEIMSLFLMYKSFPRSKTVLDEVKLQESAIKNSGFALMLQQEDGTYKESASSSWPTDMMFNAELSGCMDANGKKIDNALSYNESTNSVKVRVSGATYCYVYFDLNKPSVTLIVSTTVSTDGTKNTLPTYNHYKQTLTCDNGTTSSFNVKYQRLEISQVSNTKTNCNLNYTKDTATYTLLKDKVEQVNTTNNNGYRYSGKQPDNWVWFNNELWRIIGSVPTTLSDKTVENRIKIIRAESIGVLSYNKYASNIAWGSGNTLYTLLNSYYYGKKDATGNNLCFIYSSTEDALCNYTKKGISNDSNDYYGRMIIDVYMNAGGVEMENTINTDYTNEVGTLTSSTTKIGLMTASDYGYATSGIVYSRVNLASQYSYVNNNWLYGQGVEWTMTPRDEGDDGVMAVSFDGFGGFYADDNLAVRPVLYLDSEVYIISGEGTESSPYILGM